MLCCVAQITSPQLLQLIQTPLVMVIGEMQTTQLGTPLGSLSCGLGAVSQLSSELGLGKIQVDVGDGAVHQLTPAADEKLKREFRPVGPGRGVHDEGCSPSPGRVMDSHVVGDAMLFSKSSEQQAGHA